jgi:hypothetical protein
MLQKRIVPHLELGVVAGLLLSPSWFSQSPSSRDAAFSHRRHLARAGTSCADCHRSALASTSADDNNLPDEKTCRICHEDARPLPPSPALGRAYRFDHKLHLGFGDPGPALVQAVEAGRHLAPTPEMKQQLSTGNACLSCHRGVEQTDLAGAAHLPRMADCLVCHGKIDPPFSCPYCHTRNAALRPASHTPRFADAHSSRREVPDKSGCKVCHGVRFTCMGCH